jgi:hypothetical protein
MSIREKIIESVKEKFVMTESVNLKDLSKEHQHAYKNLKAHLNKIGSKHSIKYDEHGKSLEVAWGYDHRKDKKLLKKEEDLTQKAFYDKDFKEKKLKNAKVGFQADISGHGIHDIRE